MNALTGKHAGKFGAIAARSLHACGKDGTETGDEVDDPLVAGSRGREFPGGQMLPGVGDDTDVVGIGVSVCPGDDLQMFLCHDETALPLRVMRKGHAGRVGRQDSNGTVRNRLL